MCQDCNEPAKQPRCRVMSRTKGTFRCHMCHATRTTMCRSLGAGWGKTLNSIPIIMRTGFFRFAKKTSSVGAIAKSITFMLERAHHWDQRSIMPESSSRSTFGGRVALTRRTSRITLYQRTPWSTTCSARCTACRPSSSPRVGRRPARHGKRSQSVRPNGVEQWGPQQHQHHQLHPQEKHIQSMMISNLTASPITRSRSGRRRRRWSFSTIADFWD